MQTPFYSIAREGLYQDQLCHCHTVCPRSRCRNLCLILMKLVTDLSNPKAIRWE